MTLTQATLSEWMLGILLIGSAAGVLAFRKPMYASLSFLVSLLSLAALYLQLSAEFIGIMQVLVYAGAILVIFVFIIVLFQDAHQQLGLIQPKSRPPLLIVAGVAFLGAWFFLGKELIDIVPSQRPLPHDFGSVYGLGKALYLDFFFPFEAVILLFLVAIVGALYMAKREE